MTVNKKLLKSMTNLTSFKRLILIELLKRNTRNNLDDKLPKLLCLPHDYIGRHISVDGLYERNLLDAIFNSLLDNLKQEFSNTTALDIGANIGNHTCYFSSKFDTVIAFEPNDTVHPILEANIIINKITNTSVQKVGLSDKDDNLAFVENNDGNLGSATFTKSMTLDILNNKTLPVKNGDDLLTEHFPENKISLIKMDIEGHELRALKGLRFTLEKHSPIVLFECHNMPGLQEEGQDIIEYLKSFSYRYFYTVEAPNIKTSNKLLRSILRIFKGSSFYATKLDSLEPRFYPLIVASVNELD
jgi:FkbM family methyltransferase